MFQTSCFLYHGKHARFVLAHKLEMRKKQRRNGEYHGRKSGKEK